MSSEVSQCWAFSTHHRKMQPKHGTNLRIVHWLNLKLYLKRKFPSQHFIVDILWAICIEKASNLTCELKLDSLGLGLVLLLIVLIVDPHFPFQSSRSSPHPVLSEQLWPQSPEHPAGYSGEMTNPRTETRMRIVEPKSAQPKQTRFRSMLYHVLLSLPPPLRSKGQVQNHDHFVSGCFFVIKHVQCRKRLLSFPISCHLQIVMITLSLSCYVVLFLSCVNPVRQYHRNWHIRQGFGICTDHLRKIFQPTYISTPTQGAWQIRWSGLSISPVIVSLTTSPKVSSSSIGKKTWIMIFHWEQETLSKLDSYASPTGWPPHQSTSYIFNVEYQQCNTSRISEQL